MAIHSIAHASPRRVPAGPIDALVSLSAELASVTTLEGLRDAIAGPLRPLLPSRDISVLRAAHGKWEAAVGPEDGPERIHQYSWTPLTAEGKTVGMLGVGAPAQAAHPAGYAECATTMLAMTAQNLIAIENLRQACARDGLTGCYTRTHAMELLEANLRRASRTGLQVSVLMIDLDGFKTINDRYGHLPGDAVLAAVGAKLHRVLTRMKVGLNELSRIGEQAEDAPVRCPCVWKTEGDTVRPVTIPRYNNENRWYIEKYQFIVSLFE